MKKSVVALAALGAFAGVASAQTSVTLFGTVDPSVAIQKVSLGNGTSTNNLTMLNNGRGTTQVSVKGEVDAGGGLKGIFLYEGDHDVRQNNAAGHSVGAGGGEVYGGLAGGFGSIKLGSPNTPTLSTQAGRQPIGTKIGSGFGGAAILGTGHVRQENAIVYGSPNMGGVDFRLSYTPQVKSATATTAGAIFDAGVFGAFGPVGFGASYWTQGKQNATPQVAANAQFNLYGQFAVGPATIYAGYHDEKMTTGDKQTGLNAAFKVGVGGGVSLLGNFAKLNDKAVANLDKTIIALGGEVALGKQTVAYARFVNQKNSNVAATATAKTTTTLAGVQVNF